MVLRIFILVLIICACSKDLSAQSNECTFKPPFFRMHFGAGNVQDVNTASLAYYNRVASSCPSDGNYSYTSSTSNCFRGDWHTLTEDHTPGDAAGNMLLVNSAYNKGVFLTTNVRGFKSNTTYQFGVWLMNVCKPSDKCPFPLLPNLIIRLQTPSGKTVASFATGELQRRVAPYWTQYRAQFTVPAAEPELLLTFFNNAPGGCGNDFALDDITFRECIKPDPSAVVQARKQPQLTQKNKPEAKIPDAKKESKKAVPQPKQIDRTNPVITNAKKQIILTVNDKPQQNPQLLPVVPVPEVIKKRTNPLVKHIETAPGEIRLDLYDNGEIDGDTISIYHNNRLIVAGQRLSQKPISFRIQVDKTQPHHEFIMVANNLGSIPPNTSLMIVTINDKRYQVFISSTEQQNAKVVIDLKQ